MSNTFGFYGSLFTKFGDLEMAVQAFEVCGSSEESADEIVCSQCSVGNFSFVCFHSNILG